MTPFTLGGVTRSTREHLLDEAVLLRGITELAVASFAANAKDVDYVNAHASSTGLGEAIETRRPQPRNGSA